VFTARFATLSLLLTWISAAAGLQGAGIIAQPAPAAEVEALLKQSAEKRTSKDARHYEDQFLKAIEPVLLPAMTACTKKTPDTTTPGAIAFVIGADGRVKRLLWSANVPMAECVAQKLRSITTLPRPPEDNWVDGRSRRSP